MNKEHDLSDGLPCRTSTGAVLSDKEIGLDTDEVLNQSRSREHQVERLLNDLARSRWIVSNSIIYVTLHPQGIKFS